MNNETLSLDSDLRFEVIHRLSEKLRANYIFPDFAEQICDRLQKHLVAGDYEDIAEGDLFALALTIQLQEVNRDEHLWVRWHAESLPDDEGQLRLNREWQEQQKNKARLDNYGLYKVERLPGNVGYLDIHYFHRPAWGSETASAAMNFIANTDALIVDLRNCSGGYPDMVVLIASYLFGEQPRHLDSIYWRDENVTQEYWTTPNLPGRRYGAKPVFVLISQITFSAGEQFASILHNQKRATLLGEKTDGGAHPGVSYRLTPHFEAFIPIGLPIDPITGLNWEGTGVTPDISASGDRSFEVAYRMALESILAKLGESLTGPHKLLAEEVRSALKDLNSSSPSSGMIK